MEVHSILMSNPNVPKEFLAELQAKNLEYYTHKNIFSDEYMTFVSNLITVTDTTQMHKSDEFKLF